MSTPNPLMPQGSLPQTRGKSNVRIAVFTILAIHVVLIGGLLMQGCKRDAQSNSGETTGEQHATTTEFPPLDPQVDPGAAPVATTLPTAPATPAPVPAPAPAPVAPATVTPSVVSAAPAVPATVSYGTSSYETAAIAGEMRTHKIARGDNFSTLAKHYNVSVKAIEDANPTVVPTRLQIGQTIQIPASAPAPAVARTSAASATPAAAETGDSTVYTVKAGDVLEKIARNHGTTVKAIKTLNNLRTDRITVGQKLKIPGKATLEASAPATTTNR